MPRRQCSADHVESWVMATRRSRSPWDELTTNSLLPVFEVWRVEKYSVRDQEEGHDDLLLHRAEARIQRLALPKLHKRECGPEDRGYHARWSKVTYTSVRPRRHTDGNYRNTVANVDASDSRCWCICKIIARDLRLVASRLYRMAVTRPGHVPPLQMLRISESWNYTLSWIWDGMTITNAQSKPGVEISSKACDGWCGS